MERYWQALLAAGFFAAGALVATVGVTIAFSLSRRLDAWLAPEVVGPLLGSVLAAGVGLVAAFAVHKNEANARRREAEQQRTAAMIRAQAALMDTLTHLDWFRRAAIGSPPEGVVARAQHLADSARRLGTAVSSPIIPDIAAPVDALLPGLLAMAQDVSIAPPARSMSAKAQRDADTSDVRKLLSQQAAQYCRALQNLLHESGPRFWMVGPSGEEMLATVQEHLDAIGAATTPAEAMRRAEAAMNSLFP